MTIQEKKWFTLASLDEEEGKRFFRFNLRRPNNRKLAKQKAAIFLRLVRLINKQEQLNLDKARFFSVGAWSRKRGDKKVPTCVWVIADSAIRVSILCWLRRRKIFARCASQTNEHSTVDSDGAYTIPPTRAAPRDLSEQFFIFNQLCTHHIVVVIIILWYLQRHDGRCFVFSVCRLLLFSFRSFFDKKKSCRVIRMWGERDEGKCFINESGKTWSRRQANRKYWVRYITNQL